MCIVKYSDCPGCYGLHNNQIIEFERCMRQIHVKWGLPFPKDGSIHQKDEGPCPRALHVQYSPYDTEQYTTHEHLPSLLGQLEPKRHATLKFTGRMCDLHIVPPEQPVEDLLEEEEPTKEEWTRVLTKLAGYSEEDGSHPVLTKLAGYSEEYDDSDVGFSGPPLEMFTDRPQKSNGQQLDENGAMKANSASSPKLPGVTEWAGKTWYFPRPFLYDPNPPRRTVAKASVEVFEVPETVANNPPELEVQPTSLPSPKVEPKRPTKTKRTHTKRAGKQQPSPPASPPRAAKEPKAKSAPAKIPTRKTSQRPPTRQKKEAVRRGRPLGVKNGMKKARSGGKERPVY